MRYAGNWRSKVELASDQLLWQSHYGKHSRGRPAKTYIDQLRDDHSYTGMQTIDEMKTAMNDREGWKKYVWTTEQAPPGKTL